MRLTGQIGLITVSIFARGLFGLAISIVILERLSAQISADLFQLLLLQSIFVTLAAGAAYLQGISSADDARESATLAVGALLLCLVIGVVGGGAVSLMLATGNAPRFISAMPVSLVILWFGGTATVLHSLLQGSLLKMAGPRRVFIPGTCAYVLATPVALLLPEDGELELLGLFVAAQTLSFLLLIFVNRAEVQGFDWAEAWARPRSIFQSMYRTVNFGFVATVYLLVV